MTRPRARRPHVDPPSAEDEIAINARYRELYRFLQRLAAHRAAYQRAQDPDDDARADRSDSPGA
ncbi:hypothetical protein MCEMIH16_00946 [Caulobacteraceae bacterium]